MPRSRDDKEAWVRQAIGSLNGACDGSLIEAVNLSMSLTLLLLTMLHKGNHESVAHHFEALANSVAQEVRIHNKPVGITLQ